MARAPDFIPGRNAWNLRISKPGRALANESPRGTHSYPSLRPRPTISIHTIKHQAGSSAGPAGLHQPISKLRRSIGNSRSGKNKTEVPRRPRASRSYARTRAQVKWLTSAIWNLQTFPFQSYKRPTPAQHHSPSGSRAVSPSSVKQIVNPRNYLRSPQFLRLQKRSTVASGRRGP